MEPNNIDYHGWNIKGESSTIGIGTLPSRKRPILYIHDKCKYIPLAYFKNEESAEEAIKMFDTLIFRGVNK